MSLLLVQQSNVREKGKCNRVDVQDTIMSEQFIQRMLYAEKQGWELKIGKKILWVQ